MAPLASDAGHFTGPGRFTSRRRELTAQDPRHGRYAGAAAHEREGSELCEPCAVARRAYKRRRPQLVALGHDLVLPVGEVAYAVLTELLDHGLSTSELSAVTGLSDRNLMRIAKGGPQTRVRRRVCDQLTALDVAEALAGLRTHAGCVRRVQALARIGYSAQKVARRAGLNRDTVKRIQLGEAAYTNQDTRRRVAAVYAELCMRPLTRTNVTARTFHQAEQMEWPGPLAWDSNIDDPTASPNNVGDVDDVGDGEFLDEVAIERRLAGDRVRLTSAESREAVRRGYTCGLTSTQIAERTRLKPERYYRLRDQEGAA
ncbi:MAG: hypothetical protein ACRCYU_08535 [Nocardioides sp.]